jgi:hypothetical protein
MLWYLLDMKPLQAKPTMPWLSYKMTEGERDIVLRETQILADHEICELDTGKRIVLVRSILQKYKLFHSWLRHLPFTERTSYRRIKTYERALEMWPGETGRMILEAAIERRLQIVGWSNEKPMGLFEDVEEDPPKTGTPDKVNEYLNRLELLVRRASQQEQLPIELWDAERKSFQAVERIIRHLPAEKHDTFLSDFVGLMMSLLGADKPQKFTPSLIPQEFWLGGSMRSAETRERISKAATRRWERVKEPGEVTVTYTPPEDYSKTLKK